ncbi:mechanosensitive ion channel domain-containing protein [Schaalia sp. ORNL0103]|uniref:mechanosensitive ion channel domain-containing protein n=1 Tax=Schaalia sp. ORNL0103 TaxID=2789426 RepID=UPI001CA5156C|nr:mechanosensitive ion channel domain-containing protein [Schaalia sp. ORNL0103]MBW6413756.1 mechanosensitive ion channel [Schaalia sp. ORNL0103]
MTMTPAVGALAQASDALTRAIADPQSGAEGAVATTIDITLLILGPLVGAFVGIVLSVLLSALARKALSKAATASSILARVRRPGHFTFAAWGAWAGLGIALVNPHLSDWNGTSITTFLMHVLLVVALACLTWMAYAAAWVFEDAAKARQDSDQGRSRRFETQAQVLRRLTQSIVVVVGVVAIIGTFEVARQAMTTVLASAGVISVIAGLAAQQTLGNVFAGLQLAFTDAIRVGDVVVAGDKHETGSVEEITLSYVVVRIWDERRLIIPCRYFTQTPFENWTRRAAAQLGTVELKLDWSAPMTLIRAKVEQLLTATDLWDGRTWGVQITDSDEYTVTVRVLVSAKNSGHLSDLRAYLREQIIAWIVTEEPWARPAQRIEPRQTVTVEQDMSRERIARLAAELAGISGTNEAVAATGTSASHAGTPASAGEQSSVATGGAASAISASGAAPAAPKDPAHAARMVAARRKAKRARRRAMADRQRELAEGGPSASRDETQVISKSALRKIIEAAGNANPQLTQTLTATSIGRGERFFSGSAEAEERAAALEGPGEEVYAEREAEARRAQERREAHKRREAEALDPEATLALAAVGVEPVVADNEAPENEEPEDAQDTVPDSAAADSAEGTGAERADDATVKEAAADSVADDSADEKPESGAAGSETVDDQVEGVKPEADAESADVASAEEQAADAQPAPAQGETPADAATDAGASADSGDSRAADSQEDSAPVEDAEREGAPAPDAPEETGDEGEAQASSDVELSPDEQETMPIPARETSVKHPVQVPPPVRTGRPVMTDTVQAIAPALVPPPAPTPAEMAASRAPEDEADEPAVHPGWYAVAEEARLDAETRPTPTVKPARVSIMDFFPAVAPTGAEADMLRAVTGQIPAVEPREPKAENAESVVAEKTATDEAVAPESAPAEDSAPEVETPEVDAAQKDAADEPTADAEATIVMDPVEAEEAGALDSDATQVLPAVDEPADETLVMPAAAIAEPASEAAKAEDAAATEGVAAEEEAPAKKEPAKKTASTKAGAKKAPAKKAATKKASTAKKGAKKSSDAADKVADATPEKDAKAPAKKATAKKPAAKKGAAKKATPKKAAAKKTSNAGPATNE